MTIRIKWQKETRFCEDCSEITISSSGGALQHLPEKYYHYHCYEHIVNTVVIIIIVIIILVEPFNISQRSQSS